MMSSMVDTLLVGIVIIILLVIALLIVLLITSAIQVSFEMVLKPFFNKLFNEPDIIKAIKREYQHMDERGWDRIFLFFDLHGTVIKPNFIKGNTEIEYYPYAKETLQIMSQQSNLQLQIYTCSHPDEIEEYRQKFLKDGIEFKYVNENPDVKNGAYGNYDMKPYMNVLFEDKAGFFGETDWKPVYKFFKNKYNS